MVLGISKTASPEEIKKTIKALWRRFHPDRNKDDPRAEEICKRINLAVKRLEEDEEEQSVGGPSAVNVNDLEESEAERRAYYKEEGKPGLNNYSIKYSIRQDLMGLGWKPSQEILDLLDDMESTKQKS